MQHIAILFLAAIGYYILSKLGPSQLLAGGVVAAMAFWVLQQQRSEPIAEIAPPADRREMISERYYTERFPSKKYRYLKHNAEMVEILTSLKFTRMFNRAGYDDLALYMDRFQKIYMYILSDRYYASNYINTWLDLKESILENLYGLIFVVPDRMRHNYDIDPYERMETAKARFVKISDRMTATLRNYMMDGKGEKYFPEMGPKAYEPGKVDRLP